MNGASPSGNRTSPATYVSDPHTERRPAVTFNKEDFSFLRDFHTIVELMLAKSPPEEIGKAVAHLDERFENARQILQELPGLQYVREEQEKILQHEIAILQDKKRQLQRYMQMPPFDASSSSP